MFLSEMSSGDILGRASIEDLSKIVLERIDILPEKVSDVGLLLGGIYMIPNRANEIIELYKSGIIKKIVVSGGIGYFNKHSFPIKSEAMILREYLLKHGVRDRDIYLEDRSKSTFENIKNSLDLIRKEFGRSCLSIMLVTSDFHMRRCMALLNKINNGYYDLYCCNADTDIDYSSKKGKLILTKEVLQLVSLVKKKKIDDIEISGLSFCKKKVR